MRAAWCAMAVALSIGATGVPARAATASMGHSAPGSAASGERTSAAFPTTSMGHSAPGSAASGERTSAAFPTTSMGHSAPGSAASAALPTTVVRLELSGGTRTYRLHRTTGDRAPEPLVVVLHGAGATAREVERRYHWDTLAAREQFTVVYPQGIGRRWDDSGTSDVDFLRAVIADASQRVAVDPDRVFVTGISNGGVMTYRAGCGLADTVAAIGPVAAWFPDCLPATPISVIHVHGLEDAVLSFDGGGGSPSVPDGLAEWRSADGCTGTPSTTRSGQVTHTVWGACAPGTAVELFTIQHGRHEWPGAVPKPGNDPVSHALDATTTIWAFFRAHPRPS